MRSTLVLVVLLALVPLASADQSLVAGPAGLSTANTGSGDCSTNGYEWRGVTLAIANPLGEGSTSAVVYSTCSAYDSTYGGEHYHGQNSAMGFYAQDQRYNTQGPSAGYAWYGGQGGQEGVYGDSTYEYCGSQAYAGSADEYPGCVSPTGDAPPMLPLLP